MHSRRFPIPALMAMAAFHAAAYAQTVSPGGIVNAAGFQAPVAPGSVIAIFGTNLAASNLSAPSLPLPTTLGGTTVLVNGKLSAPLFYVSPGQINAQLPYETPPGSATLTVNGGTPASFPVAPSAPGILVYGTNRSVAVNQDYTLNSPDHPALTGGWITVYLSGQGAVNPAVVSGAASPANPVALPVLAVSATIGGHAADVLFAGMTPGGAGLFQVNLKMPALPPGDYPLIVTVGQAQSNAPLVAVSADGSPVPSIVRTIAYHQITSVLDHRGFTAISGNGAVIAYTLAASPNQIFLMNFDGTGSHLVDSYNAGCYCGSIIDISDDGSKVVSTEGVQIRLVNKGPAQPLLTLDAYYGAYISGLRIEGDGARVFFLVSRDGAVLGAQKSVFLQRGLYVINTDGSGMRQIVGPDAVATLFGTTASSNYIPAFNDTENVGNPALGVTTDGKRIVFGATKNAGAGADAIFGVNLDGSGLHIVLGPARYVTNLGISAGGSKVLYNATLSGFAAETGVVNFDGTGKLALRNDGTGVQLNADGSLLLASDTLYSTDGSGTMLQLSTLLNELTLGSPTWTGAVAMNSTATRFVYSFVPPGTYGQGLSQMATAEINPTNLGAAPVLSSPSTNPAYAVAGGNPQGTVTVAVSPHDHVLGVNYALVRNGLVEDPVNGVIFLVDDGTSGDKVAGDGIFTSNNVIARGVAQTGPRLLRLFAETKDAGGLRHGTLVDITPFSVVSQPPAH
jgi:uncharacterized protein (TIGR03437 family)